MTESNLPPGVTPEMIDAQMREDTFNCASCEKDVTDDKAELVCRDCGDPICGYCSEESSGLCKHCNQRVTEG